MDCIPTGLNIAVERFVKAFPVKAGLSCQLSNASMLDHVAQGNNKHGRIIILIRFGEKAGYFIIPQHFYRIKRG